MSELIRAGLALGVCAGLATAQGNSEKANYYPVHNVQSSVRPIVSALGDRIQKPGNERLVMTGTLTRRGVNSSAQIIRQLPGYLRVDEQGGKNKTLVYDLTDLKGSSAVDSDDEGLAESLEADTAETFLSKFGRDATVRRLGDMFQVKGETGFGATVDIYQVISTVRLKRDKQATTAKAYMFDSKTGLLRRVAYSDQGAQVQTVLSDYSQAAGYMLPGRIARIVNGSEAMVFTRTGAAIQGGAKDNTFTTGGK